MRNYLFPAIKLTLVLVLVTSGLYPLLIAGVAKMAPGGGDGRTIVYKGRVVGYANVGQSFTADTYFQGRPSAAGYNAAGSGGSNKGPSNPDYLQTVKDRIDTFLVHNPDVKRADILAELVTASGSGLDPHLSPAGAAIQIPRIAKLRGIAPAKLEALVGQHTKQPLAGMFGPATVNVLELNIALDQLK
ncbi:K(+)-transporting ATPase subunit C [Chitinophaga lutea]